MSISGTKPSFAEMLLQHLIVFLICVVFPGVATWCAPASWLTFQRSGEGVRCTARTCVFFIVPFKVQTVEEVKGITHHERAGRTEKQRKFGRTTDQTVNVDGEGFLQIHGAGDKQIEVSVSPASIERVADKANTFLHSSDRISETIFAIANWKFGAIMGGVLTSFTALYVFGYSLSFLSFVYSRLRKLMPTSKPENVAQ